MDDIPSELQAIANYSGNNSFVNDIKSKLKRFGNLSPKQIEAANRQIEKEMGGSIPTEETKKKTFVDLIKQIQQEFVRVLKDKVKEDKGISEIKISKKDILKYLK
jgi:hypothetical protein